jgi:cytochrome c1
LQLYFTTFQDYIYSLLTGYKDAPAGIELGEGQHYNPYFPGGAISMAQALYNEIIEYTDGKSTMFEP